MEIKSTIHLDNSICNLRKSVPKKSEIAKYWREKIFELGLFMDWGEPSCWACGRFESDNDVDDPNIEFNEIFKVWDKQRYLERCHVVPRSFGGCNCHGNIVLLCRECHKDNPDTDNVEMFKKWIQNRKTYSERRLKAYFEVFEIYELEITPLNFYLIHESEEFKDYLKNKAISVGNKFTSSTIVSTYKEWVDQFNDNEIIAKLPEEYKSFLTKSKDPVRDVIMLLNYFRDIFTDNIEL